jgi:hypothetical protein
MRSVSGGGLKSLHPQSAKDNTGIGFSPSIWNLAKKREDYNKRINYEKISFALN